MYRYFLKIVALFMLVAINNSAIAADSAIDSYRANTIHRVANCQLKLKNASLANEIKQLGGEITSYPPDYRDCIKTATTESKTYMQKAVNSAKSNNLKTALKNYQVALATALAGIEPGREERVISYEQRQQALSDKLNEAWQRVDIER